MEATMRLSIVGCILSRILLGAMCFAGEEAGPNAAQTIAKIGQAWQHRQQIANRVLYRLKGTETVPKGSWSGAEYLPSVVKANFPERDLNFQLTRALLLDFERNRVRWEGVQHFLFTEKGVFLPHYFTKVFDGAVTKSWEPRAA